MATRIRTRCHAFEAGKDGENLQNILQEFIIINILDLKPINFLFLVK